jgi:hypothetical protein
MKAPPPLADPQGSFILQHNGVNMMILTGKFFFDKFFAQSIIVGKQLIIIKLIKHYTV